MFVCDVRRCAGFRTHPHRHNAQYTIKDAARAARLRELEARVLAAQEGSMARTAAEEEGALTRLRLALEKERYESVRLSPSLEMGERGLCVRVCVFVCL